jgi:hypothetical protein
MNLEIKYNNNNDEFKQDIDFQMRIQRYIKNHFYPAYTISKHSNIYLLGGGIRDLLVAKIPKDLDFVVLGNDKKWIDEVFRIYKIRPHRNRFGGFKFEYSGTKVDLWLSEDLFSAIQYNIDGLFYDVKNNSLISLTFDDFLKNGLRLINPDNNIEKGRKEKLLKYEKEYRNIIYKK